MLTTSSFADLSRGLGCRLPYCSFRHTNKPDIKKHTGHCLMNHAILNLVLRTHLKMSPKYFNEGRVFRVPVSINKILNGQRPNKVMCLCSRVISASTVYCLFLGRMLLAYSAVHVCSQALCRRLVLFIY